MPPPRDLPKEHEQKVRTASWGRVVAGIPCPLCEVVNDAETRLCFSCGASLIAPPKPKGPTFPALARLSLAVLMLLFTVFLVGACGGSYLLLVPYSMGRGEEGARGVVFLITLVFIISVVIFGITLLETVSARFFRREIDL